MNNKELYDFSAKSNADVVDDDRFTATGTHVINGWGEYQRWLEALRADVAGSVEKVRQAGLAGRSR